MKAPIIIRILVLVVSIIVIVSTAGFLFLSLPAGPVKKDKKAIETEVRYDPVIGYIASPEASSGSTEFSTVIETGEVKVLGASLEIIVYDWDDAHARTDEGSDADTVVVRINNNSIDMYTDTSDNGMAYMYSSYYDNTEPSTVDGFNITVEGVDFGDGVYEKGPFGIFDIPFREYDDQGAGFEIYISLIIVEYV